MGLLNVCLSTDPTLDPNGPERAALQGDGDGKLFEPSGAARVLSPSVVWC